MRRAWHRLLRRFRAAEPSHRPGHVRGPAGAIILYLLESGRGPAEPDVRHAPPDFPGDLQSWKCPEADLSGDLVRDPPEPLLDEFLHLRELVSGRKPSNIGVGMV